MIIRKISIGSDYKSSAMHYLVGQAILGGSYTIHHIRMERDNSIKIWIEKEDEVVLWKEFNSNMPVSIEYNINF
tara:strand:- start:643 stop:864 length:222 start_codon:yes stop_codon:yes gene_type:complete